MGAVATTIRSRPPHSSATGMARARQIEARRQQREGRMKLFTIGDSISQGFMSAGAAKPQFSYNTHLAKALGAQDYSYLSWKPEHHLKFDLELILRKLQEPPIGSDIRGLEWPLALKRISDVLDVAEDYYERGEGRLGLPIAGRQWFDSVAVEGMDVADAWLVTPASCRAAVTSPKSKAARKDNLFGSASDSFYRNAYRVLNPGGQALEAEYGELSAVRWLDVHARREGGVENTIVWLGANNALGTVLELKIKQTPGNGEPMAATREARRAWNLWHPHDFRLEYHELMRRVDGSMRVNLAKDWRVFVGTIPFVTIAPLAKGMGEPRPVEDASGLKGLYYQYYSYFPFSLQTALSSGRYLTFRDALHIDRTIQEFNHIIRNEVAALNEAHGAERYFVVDLADTLSQLAWKRNKGQPTYQLPEELRFIYPPLDTKYYDVRPNGRIQGGGIFSLDGIHPSTSAHGIIAWEFMKVMQRAKVLGEGAKPDWAAILAADTLRNDPIRLLHEIYDHDRLIRTVLDAIRLIRD
jgi:hypothetical protein